MPISQSSGAKKFLNFTFKLLGTALVWIGTAILTKLQLAPDAKNLQTTLQQLPLWALAALVVVLPIAWLLVEFIATCFMEVRARVLEHAAPRFAQWLTESPTAGRAVLGRWWDLCLARLGRWRFDGRYRMRIAEECQQLHAQTGLLHATAGFSLEEAYTELNMASAQYGEIDQSLLATCTRGRESIYGFVRMQQPGTALALLGRPGGGKTTLLRHLALLYALNKQGHHRLRRRMPIIIELRRVTDLFIDKGGAEWKSPTLIQVIQHFWKQHSALGGLMAKAPKDWLKRHLASGRVLVMVDGLDEVPHQQDRGKPHRLTTRQRVAQWIEIEMQREGQRDCLFLITSRPGGFAEAPVKQRVSVVEVQPLTLEQSERFIYAFQIGCQRKAHPTAKMFHLQVEAARATQKLQQELRVKPHLSDLRVNPLLLHMVCLLHHLRGRLPADRSDLYKETCDVLLNRDLRAPGFQERLRPEDKLAALRPLANYFMRSASPQAKSTDELLPIVQPVFETLNFPARDFFAYASKDSGLLQEVEQERWDFAHKTFYEYLTAEHWERHPPSKKELAEWVEQDWWRVTLLFYSAKSEDSPVISAALSKRTPKAWSLAFACLSAGHRINATERERANSQLQKALSNPADQQSFLPAAQALLDLRMRETVSASSDGKWLRRSTFVTQVEYQLFLLSHPLHVRIFLVPPHWKEDRFSGDPSAPILGVTPHQARVFAEWAKTTGDQGWRLPPLELKDADLPDGCWLATEEPNFFPYRLRDRNGQTRENLTRWLKSNGLVSLPDEPLEELLEPRALLRARSVSARISRSLRLLIPSFHLTRMPGFWLIRHSRATKDQALVGYLAWTLANFALAEARLEDNSGSKSSFQQHEYILGHLNSMVPFAILGRAFFSTKVFSNVSFARTMNNSLRGQDSNPSNEIYNLLRWMCFNLETESKSVERILTTALPKEGPELRIVKIIIDNLEKDALSDNEVAIKRHCLLLQALKVVASQSATIESRQAWLRFGICVAEMIDPHTDNNLGMHVRSLISKLKLLEARMEGKFDPWEGILLVRQT